MSGDKKDGPSQSNFIFRLYTFLSQILAIRKTREFVLLVHIVANYSAASLMLEELLLNLAFLQPG